MMPTVAELPDDIDTLKAMVRATVEQRAAMEAENSRIASEIAALKLINTTSDARIAELTAIVKTFERMLYGTRSERLRGERLDDEQIDFVFDEIETGVAAIDAELETGAKDKPKRAPRPRKGFAPHLERIEQVIEPEVPAGYEDLEKVLIGEDVSERLDVTAAKFRVIVTRRPKYAYRGRDGGSRPRRRPISSKAAFRRRRFWPRSPSPNMPTACRCIGRRRSTPATRPN